MVFAKGFCISEKLRRQVRGLTQGTTNTQEAVSLSLNNILQQTGMTMMAQANQSTEGILALLR